MLFGFVVKTEFSLSLLLQLFPGSVDRLQSVEERLLETVGQLKARLEWLNSGR